MDGLFSRNESIWGKPVQNMLKSKLVTVFGLGGVGGACAEALYRSGVGQKMILQNGLPDPLHIGAAYVDIAMVPMG